MSNHEQNTEISHIDIIVLKTIMKQNNLNINDDYQRLIIFEELLHDMFKINNMFNKFNVPIDFNELKQLLEKEHQIIYNMYKIIHTKFYIKLAKNDDSNIEELKKNFLNYHLELKRNHNDQKQIMINQKVWPDDIIKTRNY
jgi:hypothetical protein